MSPLAKRLGRAGAYVVATVAAVVVLGLVGWMVVILLTPDEGRGDRLLGLVESAGLAASLWILWVFARTGRRSWTLAIPLVLAATVVQPFGVRASRVTDRAPSGAEMRSASDTQRMEVAGTPLVAFRMYARHRIPATEGGNPTHDLRTRSWTPPLLFADAGTVSPMCGSTSNICWQPPSEPWRPGGRSAVVLFQRDGDWFVRGTTSDSSSSQTWRLTWTVVSPVGAGFWVLLAVSVVLGLRARRFPSRGRAPGLTA